MKILQISPYSQVLVGGSQGFCFDLSKQLHKHGHDVTVWTSRFPRDLPKVDYSLGFPVKHFFMLTNVWQINPTVMLVGDVLREIEKFDIVHCHSYIFFACNQVSFCRLLKRFKYVLHLHGGLGDLNPNLVGVKRFVAKRFFDKTVGALTIKNADHVISVSQADADYVIERYNVARSKISVIPNAVDSSQFKLAVDSVPRIACYVGRLTRWKGSQVMPKIFNALIDSGVHVRVVGYGPELDFLKQNCRSEVEFAGYVPKERIPEMLSDVSCLLLPSFLEGLPTVCLEAMAAGVPSIAYNVGGVSECVRDGVTGFVVPKGDVNVFVDKTLRCLDHNNFRDNCVKIARGEYDWSVVTEKIEKVYKRCLRR